MKTTRIIVDSTNADDVRTIRVFAQSRGMKFTVEESEPVSKFVSNVRKDEKAFVNGLVPLPEAA